MNRLPLSITVLAMLLLASGPAAAQDHSRHAQPQDERERAASEQRASSESADEHEHARSNDADGHAGHGRVDAVEAQRDQAGEHHGMDHGQMDHGEMDHAEMDQPEMDHSEMSHSQMGHDMPPARHEPRTPIPVLTDADRAAAFQDLADHATHDQRIVRMVQFNRLEATDGDHGSGVAWEGMAWVGNDWNKLWLRSEGERSGGDLEAADLEVLYGRPVARWWDAVVGLRHDFKPGDSRTWAAVGVMGLAPQWFEIEATAYLGESGDLAGSFEAEYELLLTNRLILQPLFEVTVYSEDDPLRGIGSGLGTAELGLRLRYEFDRKFAPYIGVVHERSFGNTADLRRDEGEGVDDTLLVAGIRFWF